VKIDYFVSYYAISKRGAQNVGRSSIKTEKPIRSDADVKLIEVHIAKINDFKKVVLLHFVRFEKEEAATS
jgi:hypothetical protein